jgi:hypothetical protein
MLLAPSPVRRARRGLGHRAARRSKCRQEIPSTPRSPPAVGSSTCGSDRARFVRAGARSSSGSARGAGRRRAGGRMVAARCSGGARPLCRLRQLTTQETSPLHRSRGACPVICRSGLGQGDGSRPRRMRCRSPKTTPLCSRGWTRAAFLYCARTNPRRRGRWRVATRQKNCVSVEDVVPDWQAGAAALRRTTACSGGGVAATNQGWTVNQTATGGGRFLKYRPPRDPCQPLDRSRAVWIGRDSQA